MAIRIAQAASSENFSIWGMPPNQRRTGVTPDNPGGNLDGELNISPFGGQWECVLRPTDDALAERLAWLFERAVMNGSHIGYSQCNEKYPRTGVFDALKRQEDAGQEVDPLAIDTLVNCDCSSLMGAGVYFSGIRDERLRDMWTGNERAILLSSGYFVQIEDKEMLQSGVGLKRGDVLWRTGHTAVCLDNDGGRITEPCEIVNCKACNLRKGPGTGYAVVKVLMNGTRGELLSRAENGWGQMIIDGRVGYVSPKYYKILDTATATGDVWQRKDAGTKYAKVQVIPKGATVYLTGKTRKILLTTWYDCVYIGRTGWASGKFIKPD